MGGTVSSGESNDDLIDNLKEADYIKSPLVEQIFRAVDRGFYYTKNNHQNPYTDSAWKYGNLHLSAPCIYSEVLENLKLEPGLSFLNIGSGTGYLSTMAGLILGRGGINHGIELHADVVEYARFKLDRFRKSSAAVDLYEFCEPNFVVGNCMEAVPISARYDRIYCGAACPEKYLQVIIELLKIGGILVVPLGDSLQQIKRVSETDTESVSLLNVSFASLVESSVNKSKGTVKFPEWNPLKLSEICRANIRAAIRKNCVKIEPPARQPSSAPKNGTEGSSGNRPRRDRRLERGSCVFTRIQATPRNEENGNVRRTPGIVSIAYALADESSSDLSTVSDGEAPEDLRVPPHPNASSASTSSLSAIKAETENDSSMVQNDDEREEAANSDADEEMKDVTSSSSSIPTIIAKKENDDELEEANASSSLAKLTNSSKANSSSSSNNNNNNNNHNRKKKKSEDERMEEGCISTDTDDTNDDGTCSFPSRRRRATPTSPTPAVSVSVSSSTPPPPPSKCQSPLNENSTTNDSSRSQSLSSLRTNEQSPNVNPSIRPSSTNSSFSSSVSSVFEAFMRSRDRRRLHLTNCGSSNSSGSSTRGNRCGAHRFRREQSPHSLVLGLNSSSSSGPSNVTNLHRSNNRASFGATTSTSTSRDSPLPSHDDHDDSVYENMVEAQAEAVAENLATQARSSDDDDDDDNNDQSVSKNEVSSSSVSNNNNNDENDPQEEVTRRRRRRRNDSDSRDEDDDDHSHSDHEENEERSASNRRYHYFRHRPQSENLQIRNELVFLNLPEDLAGDSDDDDTDGSRDGPRLSASDNLPDLQQEYECEPCQPVTHEFFIQMRDKIKKLPLPPALLVYLNYDRSL